MPRLNGLTHALAGIMLVLPSTIASAALADEGIPETPPLFGFALEQNECRTSMVIDGIPVLTGNQSTAESGFLPINHFISGTSFNVQMAIEPFGLDFNRYSTCLADFSVSVQLDEERYGHIDLGIMGVASPANEARTLVDASSEAVDYPWGSIGEVEVRRFLSSDEKTVRRIVLERDIVIDTGQPEWAFVSGPVPEMSEAETLRALFDANQELWTAIESNSREDLERINQELVEETSLAYAGRPDWMSYSVDDAEELKSNGFRLRPLDITRMEVKSYADGRLFELMWIGGDLSAIAFDKEDASSAIRTLWRWDGERFVLSR